MATLNEQGYSFLDTEKTDGGDKGLERFLRIAFVLLGGLLSFKGASFLLAQEFMQSVSSQGYVTGVLVAGGALIGYGVGQWIIAGFTGTIAGAISSLQKTPTNQVLAGVMGLIMGLLIAILITIPLPKEIPYIGPFLPVLITLVLGYIGMMVGFRKQELFGLITRSFDRGSGPKDKKGGTIPKILDTSVIIDGRILDITKSGFIEGPLVVPGFVLEELQHIADSSDVLKRNRGRRGLDILNKIQKEAYVAVQIVNKNYEDTTEVDSKLVRLAKEMQGKVLTNDFNLNKVCELQGVMVLNINELANAVKPVVLPGEELRVYVIKDGKEQGQGIAYLDDGTMIVVDGGRKFIGDTVAVLVTSVLQTAAGRMIFAKPKALDKAL